jgi:aconitase A
MCPEYGATVGFFAVDEQSLAYLKQTGKIFYKKFINIFINTVYKIILKYFIRYINIFFSVL